MSYTFPKYSVGQKIMAPTDFFAGDNAPRLAATIVLPIENDTYLVRYDASDNYAVLDDNEITRVSGDAPYVSRRDIGIVFFGNGEFALSALKHLHAHGYRIRLVVCSPCKSLHENHAPNPVKTYAENWGLPWIQQANLSDESFLSLIESIEPTIGVVVSFKILPKELLAIPRFGFVNLHNSLLPRYRGASAISECLRNGDAVTGVTAIEVTDKVDSGNVIENYGFFVGDTDTASDLEAKVNEVGPFVLTKAVRARVLGRESVPQDFLTHKWLKPTETRKVRPNVDCMIDWRNSVKDVCNLIRAYSPKPGARTRLGSEMMKVLSARPCDFVVAGCPVGRFYSHNGELYVNCKDGSVNILTLRLPGKNTITGRDFVNSYGGIL